MKIACDADGLIKLNRAGILHLVAERFELLIGPEVYREAVIEGKTRGHGDAVEIERVIKSPRSLKITKRRARKALDESELGAGEQETLELFSKRGAAAILSDDRRFLRELDRLQIPYLTPAAMLVALAEHGVLTQAHALGALKKLAVYIRQDQCRVALAELQARRKEKR